MASSNKNLQNHSRVTVVIAAKDEQRHLPRCLRSILRQDFEGKTEIIVVDNASTDETARIASDFGCRVVFEPTPGQILAKSRGCEAARSPTIAVLDADCLAPCGWLSTIHSLLHAENSIVAVSGPYRYRQLPCWAQIYQNVTTKPLIGLGQRLFKSLPFVFGGNVAFKRDAYFNAGGYGSVSHWSAAEFGLAKRLRQQGVVLFSNSMYVKTSPRRFYSGWENYWKYRVRDYFGTNVRAT